METSQALTEPILGTSSAKVKQGDEINDAKSFLRRNKKRERISEYKDHLKKGDYETSGEIQRDITRGNWRTFTESPKIFDLRNVFENFAKAEGRGSAGGKPLREEGRVFFHPREKAEVIGRIFANKMATTRDGRKISIEEIRARVQKLTTSGKLTLETDVHVDEIRLAVRDIPKNKGRNVYQRSQANFRQKCISTAPQCINALRSCSQ